MGAGQPVWLGSQCGWAPETLCSPKYPISLHTSLSTHKVLHMMSSTYTKQVLFYFLSWEMAKDVLYCSGRFCWYHQHSSDIYMRFKLYNFCNFNFWFNFAYLCVLQVSLSPVLQLWHVSELLLLRTQGQRSQTHSPYARVLHSSKYTYTYSSQTPTCIPIVHRPPVQLCSQGFS